MISYNLPFEDQSTMKKHELDAFMRKTPRRCEKRQRHSTTQKDVSMSDPEQSVAPVPRHANLFDILDEDLVLSNTPIGFHCSKRLKPVASGREGRGRVTILDQIDGLVKEDGDSFMTSMSYPRGVHIIPRDSQESSSAIDLVLAEESFRYWKHEIENSEPLFASLERQ